MSLRKHIQLISLFSKLEDVEMKLDDFQDSKERKEVSKTRFTDRRSKCMTAIASEDCLFEAFIVQWGYESDVFYLIL
jgi:hypothetical protein